MARYDPPVAFHFRVDVLGIGTANDARFADVGGLSVETPTEEVPEGGENRFVQRYPTRTRYPELVLKRGLLIGSAVFDWIRACLVDQQIAPKDLDVKLLDEEHAPLFTWHVVKAFPTKWSVSDLSATANAVVIESLQLSYQYFRVDGG